MSKRIFITEDEEDIREVIQCTLESFSYEIEAFESAEECLAAAEQSPPDLILMDIMLPGMDGIAALKKLKAQKKTAPVPVIMLTAKSSEVDKVTGLDSGADDYITKPFGILELAARVRAALRKGETMAQKPEVITLGEITLDVDKRTVSKAGAPVELTLKEFALLKMLMENKDRVLPRETLLDEIWGYDYVGETRTLDMHVRTLRNKLGDNGETQRYIKTVRGVGYRFIG
ncbi:response regulator transcription factor [Zongyangia hominis]|uniref:Stage 0 sporulation protein A homolog n=1 Tax=Zongyangia hominis TaxID=2763677 RepID=A0A926ECR3_9FIRM|nr:response regulator transcription factor [Zongyangia hominis]MBC8570668.1 response regulator transcription factor [Zongyangia hominis]